MGDIADILGISRGSGALDVAKPVKEKVVRPAGMSREAFALLGDRVAVMPTTPLDLLKKKEAGLKEKRKQAARGEKVLYVWQDFTNEARTDGLKLKHWVKLVKDAQGNIKNKESEEYYFARFNVKTKVYRYTEQEYGEVLRADPDWSREESDYLLDLCERFDLRWVVITDRYEFPGGNERSMEDLKARYYAIARQLVVARDGSQEAAANLSLIRHPYNADHERDRKRGIQQIMTRTPKQNDEEREILEQAAKIEAARRLDAAQRPAPQRTRSPSVDIPAPQEFLEPLPAGTSSLFDADVNPCKPRPGVYARGLKTQEVGAQQMATIVGGSRQQKIVETWLGDNNGQPPIVPQRATCGAWLALRKEAIAMFELKRRLASGQGGGSVPPGDRGGKRPAKPKAPRVDDMSGLVETPKHDKRPRTAKKFADE